MQTTKNYLLEAIQIALARRSTDVLVSLRVHTEGQERLTDKCMINMCHGNM